MGSRSLLCRNRMWAPTGRRIPTARTSLMNRRRASWTATRK